MNRKILVMLFFLIYFCSYEFEINLEGFNLVLEETFPLIFN